MNNENQNHSIEPFEKIVYAYTRAQAIADGFQIDVSATAKEAGICSGLHYARSLRPLRGDSAGRQLPG